MNLRQLECFVAVAEEGSFTRAAERVGIAQPSLSQHIRALEEELNGAVVTRLPHGAALTPAGRSLLGRATPVWERTHGQLEDRLARGEPDRLRGSLRALS